jgi:hypothetical protein
MIMSSNAAMNPAKSLDCRECSISGIIPLFAGIAVNFSFAEKLELQESQTAFWEELLEVARAL